MGSRAPRNGLGDRGVGADSHGVDAEAATWGIARTMTPDLNCADRFTSLGDLEITGKAIDTHTWS